MKRRHSLHPRGPWFWVLVLAVVALTLWALWPRALASSPAGAAWSAVARVAAAG